MAGVIATIPKFQFSANGVPMIGGTLDTYIAGSTTPATTWQDSALTIANTNPISLDARGECVLWLDPAVVYKFVLKNAQGVIQWTQDNISNPAALANSLRADLAAPSGASLIGYGTGNVAGAIDGNTNAIANNATLNSQFQANLFSSPINPLTIDMHYGVLRGRGWTAGDPVWTSGDPQNIKSTVSTAAVSTSGMDIPVASSTGFAEGMLICYLGTDGNYYSAKLHAINAGPVFRLGETLQVAIASGAPVYNFYRDDAHPNTYGGAAIVDDALARLSEYRARRLEHRTHDGLSWTPVLGATLTSLTTTTYGNPSEAAASRRGISIYSTTADAGAVTPYVALEGGDYIASIPVNPGLRDGGFSGWADVYVQEVTPEGDSYTIASAGAIQGYDSIRLLEIPFSCRPGAAIRVSVTSPNTGGFTLYVGPLSYYKLAERIAPINRGKHVLFGDSWFSAGSAIATRFTARLDKAQVVVKGVSGNRASQLIERFDTDVVGENPDYVWVMVGTNDYYAGVTPSLFEQQILQLRRMIHAIGAQPIFFNASVGAITYVPEKLTVSREYAARVRYQDINNGPDGASAIQRSAHFHGQSLSIAAGATVVVGISAGQTRAQALLRYAGLTTASVQLIIDYPSAVDGAGAVDPTTFSGASAYENKFAQRGTDKYPRYVGVRLKNPTGSAIVVSYAIDICWQQKT